MTLTDEPTTLPPPQDHHEDRLRRSRRRRMLAGVAGGISERFDVDVSLVRVAFVVLACAWGFGVLVYLAMWALVPRSRDDGAPGEEEGVAPTSTWLAALLLIGVLVLGLLVASSWWRGPRWGGGLGLLWLLVVGVLAIVALRDHGSGRSHGASLGRLLVLLGVGVVTLMIVVTGAFFALVASTGVPLSGGMGDVVYQPTSVAQVQRTYRASIGSLTVDLRRVHFAGSVVHVTATVAVGVVTVEVPPGVVVDVNAHSGVGNVTSSPGDLQSFSDPSRGDAGAPAQLDLTAAAGVGQVRLIRGAAL